VLMNAEQKSFIVNAAALKLFGYGDFVNRILKPNIKSLKERTGQVIELATITQPQQQVQGDTPIAASNRELYIPPLLAEEIGYELLEKINNRGKPETEKKLEEQKQKEQPQEPQAAMQAALGKRIGMNKGGEVEMLARLLIAEAVSGKDTEETYRNMQSVANIVSNRLKDKTTDFRKYKNFKDVISAKTKGGANQFSGYQNKNYKKANKDKRYSTALDIASKAISGTLEDITEGATFFYNPNETRPGKAKFFEDRLKSGRFQLVDTIGLHDILFDTNSSLQRPIPTPKEKPRLAKDTSPIADINSPPEGRELLKKPPRGMRSGLDKVQPVMDKREITQFPERVLQ
jgi:spore germination cell wall hydrolase CwlJ-like protein